MTETPRFLVESAHKQTAAEPQPYDALIYSGSGLNRVGFVRDNFICEVTENDGKSNSKRVPATICYSKKPRDECWDRQRLGYLEGVAQALQSPGLSHLPVYDPVSELTFMTVPLEAGVVHEDAKSNLVRFLARDNYYQDMVGLRNLINKFDTVKFGLFGSRSIQGVKSSVAPDVDLVIYGYKDYQRVVHYLENDVQLRGELGISLRPPETIKRNTKHYMEKFKIGRAEAYLMSIRRRRYILLPEAKLTINLGLLPEEIPLQVPLVVGSRKISEFAAEGLAVDTRFSSTQPRVYTIEIDGENVNVISRDWSHKDAAKDGERVKIKGTLRSNDGRDFISLENSGDMIQPII